jgi:hypothetical protein
MLPAPRFSKSVQVYLVHIFIFSAVLVSVIRSLGPLMIFSDPSVQIGAALNWLSGDGFGIYQLGSDIAQPPRLEAVTLYPPGFSILVFLGLKIGLPLDVTLKVLYTAATLIGWYGWGRILQAILKLIDSPSFWGSAIALVFATILPLCFTFDWCGTDIFLWAGIPFVISLVYLLVRDASLKPDNFLLSRLFQLGLLISLLGAIRYIAVFLIPYVAVLILLQGKRLAQLTYLTYGLLACSVAAIAYKIFWSPQQTAHFSTMQVLDSDYLITRVTVMLKNFQQFGILLFSHLNQYPVLHWPALGIFLSSFFVLLLSRQQTLSARRKPTPVPIITDLKELLEGLHPSEVRQNWLSTLQEHLLLVNVVFVVFLIIISFFTTVGAYFNEPRYFYPLFPSLLWLAYSLIFRCLKHVHPMDWQNWLFRGLQGVSALYLALFLSFAGRSLLFYPMRVLGFHYIPDNSLVTYPADYPSRTLMTRHPQSYDRLMAMLRQDPKAIAISFANNLDFNHVTEMGVRRRIFRANQVFELAGAVASQGVRAYLVLDDPAINCTSEYCYFDSGRAIEFIDRLRSVKSVYQNKTEKIHVLLVEIPTGFRFRQ